MALNSRNSLDMNDIRDETNSEMEDLSSESLIPNADAHIAISNTFRPRPTLSFPFIIRDTKYSFFFLCHLIIAIIISSLLLHHEESTSKGLFISSISSNLSSLSGIVILLSILYSITWVYVYIIHFQATFIYLSCGLSFLGLFPLACLLFFCHTTYGTLLGLLLLVMILSDLYWMKKKARNFEFLIVMLQLVMKFLQHNLALTTITLVLLIGYSCWALWCASVLSILLSSQVTEENELMRYVLIGYMYFHFFWTSQIWRNILGVTVSGTLMIWYYDTSIEESPMHKRKQQVQSSEQRKNTNNQIAFIYLKRALIASFGSICIGSLLTPIAHLLWNILRSIKRRLKPTNGVRSTILTKIELFISTYHKYSFSYVAGYGKSFHVAARETWKLLEERSVEAILDDDLTGRLVLFATNACASIITLLCGTASLDKGFSSELWLSGTILFYILSHSTFSIVSQLVIASVKTLFVCFAENPSTLSQLNPIIYHRLIRLSEIRHFGNDQEGF